MFTHSLRAPMQLVYTFGSHHGVPYPCAVSENRAHSQRLASWASLGYAAESHILVPSVKIELSLNGLQVEPIWLSQRSPVSLSRQRNLRSRSTACKFSTLIYNKCSGYLIHWRILMITATWSYPHYKSIDYI